MSPCGRSAQRPSLLASSTLSLTALTLAAAIPSAASQLSIQIQTPAAAYGGGDSMRIRARDRAGAAGDMLYIKLVQASADTTTHCTGHQGTVSKADGEMLLDRSVALSATGKSTSDWQVPNVKYSEPGATYRILVSKDPLIAQTSGDGVACNADDWAVTPAFSLAYDSQTPAVIGGLSKDRAAQLLLRPGGSVQIKVTGVDWGGGVGPPAVANLYMELQASTNAFYGCDGAADSAYINTSPCSWIQARPAGTRSSYEGWLQVVESIDGSSMTYTWNVPEYNAVIYRGRTKKEQLVNGVLVTDVKSLSEPSHSLDSEGVTLRVYMRGLDSTMSIVTCLQDHNEDNVCAGKPVDVEDLYSAIFTVRRKGSCGDKDGSGPGSAKVADGQCGGGHVRRPNTDGAECAGDVCDVSSTAAADFYTCCMATTTETSTTGTATETTESATSTTATETTTTNTDTSATATVTSTSATVTSTSASGTSTTISGTSTTATDTSTSASSTSTTATATDTTATDTSTFQITAATTSNACPDGVQGYTRILGRHAATGGENSDLVLAATNGVVDADACAVLCSTTDVGCTYFTFRLKPKGRCTRFSRTPVTTSKGSTNAFERQYNCVTVTSTTASTSTSATVTDSSTTVSATSITETGTPTTVSATSTTSTTRTRTIATMTSTTATVTTGTETSITASGTSTTATETSTSISETSVTATVTSTSATDTSTTKTDTSTSKTDTSTTATGTSTTATDTSTTASSTTATETSTSKTDTSSTATDTSTTASSTTKTDTSTSKTDTSTTATGTSTTATDTSTTASSTSATKTSTSKTDTSSTATDTSTRATSTTGTATSAMQTRAMSSTQTATSGTSTTVTTSSTTATTSAAPAANAKPVGTLADPEKRTDTYRPGDADQSVSKPGSAPEKDSASIGDSNEGGNQKKKSLSGPILAIFLPLLAILLVIGFFWKRRFDTAKGSADLMAGLSGVATSTSFSTEIAAMRDAELRAGVVQFEGNWATGIGPAPQHHRGVDLCFNPTYGGLERAPGGHGARTASNETYGSADCGQRMVIDGAYGHTKPVGGDTTSALRMAENVTYGTSGGTVGPHRVASNPTYGGSDDIRQVALGIASGKGPVPNVDLDGYLIPGMRTASNPTYGHVLHGGDSGSANTPDRNSSGADDVYAEVSPVEALEDTYGAVQDLSAPRVSSMALRLDSLEELYRSNSARTSAEDSTASARTRERSGAAVPTPPLVFMTAGRSFGCEAHVSKAEYLGDEDGYVDIETGSLYVRDGSLPGGRPGVDIETGGLYVRDGSSPGGHPSTFYASMSPPKPAGQRQSWLRMVDEGAQRTSGGAPMVQVTATNPTVFVRLSAHERARRKTEQSVFEEKQFGLEAMQSAGSGSNIRLKSIRRTNPLHTTMDDAGASTGAGAGAGVGPGGLVGAARSVRQTPTPPSASGRKSILRPPPVFGAPRRASSSIDPLMASTASFGRPSEGAQLPGELEFDNDGNQVSSPIPSLMGSWPTSLHMQYRSSRSTSPRTSRSAGDVELTLV